MNTFKIFAPMLKASMGPDGKMRLHGIASSTVKDRHGDTMSPSALMDMERSANQNLTIFLNHEYKVPEDVAGHVERAIIRSHPQDPDIHDLEMDIVVNEKNERAVKAWEAIDKAIEKGSKLGISIGAMIPEGGAIRDRKTGTYQIDHVELLETSLVGVPANPRSWVEYAVKSLGSVSSLELDADDLEHTDDPPEEPVEEPTEEDPEVEKAVATGEAEPELCEECGLAIDECKCNNRRRKDAETGATVEIGAGQTTSNGSSATFTITPDTTDATVSIETPYANISIDTGNRGTKPAPVDGSSQEALASAPESEDADEEAETNPWAGILPTKSGESLLEADVEQALQILEPTLVASLRSSGDLMRAITRELIDTREALRVRNEEYAALEEETKKVLSETAQILDTLSSTPLGRRAVVREAGEEFASLREVYGEQFVNILKRS